MLQYVKQNKQKFFLKLIGALCIAIACFISPCTFASPEANTAQFVEYLASEKVQLTIAINEIKRMTPPLDEQQLLENIKNNANKHAMNRSRIEHLEAFLVNQEKQASIYVEKMKSLQQAPSHSLDLSEVQERSSKLENLASVNRKTIELIHENLDLAKQYEQLLLNEKQQQSLWQAKFTLQQSLDAIHQKEDSLRNTLSELYQQNIEEQQKKTSATDVALQWRLEAKMILNNLNIILIQQQLSELSVQKNLQKTEYAVLKNESINALQLSTETYKDALAQFQGMENTLKRVKKQLTRDASLFTANALKEDYEIIEKATVDRLKDLSLQQKSVQESLDEDQKRLKKEVATRQSLADYRINNWSQIIKECLLVPDQTYHYLKSLVVKIKDNYLWQDALPATLFWIVLGLVICLALYGKRTLRSLTENKERSRLTMHLYSGSLTLIYRNLPLLTAWAILHVIFYFNHIPYTSYALLTNILLVWLIFRSLIIISRLVLLERITDSSGKDVRLYYRLKWLLLLGGWITVLMVFSHQLPLSTLMQDMFNRLFILFILAISIVAWKSKDIIPYLLTPIATYNKRYIKNAISLLIILVPLTLFITALIGLWGYINLAWGMSSYLAKTILVVIGYVLMRGLLFDLLDLLSEWMIASMRNGWLWIEVFLKPLDKIIRIVIFLVSVLFLFALFGWFSDSFVLTKIFEISQYSVLNVSGIHITIISIIEFVMLLSVLIWVSKWSREFCYRWLYRNTADIGIRHSLSVFTQYAVIIIGGVITLRVLGIDFSGMSIVLGGLAVGMGFSLRDFASNIVGGIMLLIERPVREGDLVTIGGYEGRVAHIGIRSMRVSSWDNMEVLIPNAETFNKPFTNWTHQDSIVRTVVPIKVSRLDDPTLIQQLILDVLSIIPEILSDPPAQVFLKQIDEALIEFEVRYFINVDLYTRFEVRSKVLFAISAQFTAAGVKAPIPPVRVALNEDQGDFFIGTGPTKE